ncbi:MAG: hypothetical protein NVS1B10_07830 [Candidatus Saccharimonadales bacterium]
MSFGFVIVTRMLQRYPELNKKINLVISIVGFAHHDDFTFSFLRYHFYLNATRLLSLRVPAFIFRHTALNHLILRTFYGRTHNAKHKFAQAKNPEELEKIQQVEVSLWHDNDVRTWAFTSTQFLTFDNCQSRVNLPFWHISAKADHFFNNHLVEQHLRVIFSSYTSAEINLETHAPSVIADEKAAAALVPIKLRRAIARLK